MFYSKRVVALIFILISSPSPLYARAATEVFCLTNYLKTQLEARTTPTEDTVHRILDSFAQHDPRVLPEGALENVSGGFNNGIYRYRAQDGTYRIMKALKLELDRNETTGKTEISHSESRLPNKTDPYQQLLQELRGALLLEKAGGPPLYTYGVLHVGDHRYAYIEMEAVFQNEPFITAKGGGPTKITELKSLNRENRFITDQMASHFLDCLKLGLDPIDPDFAISREKKLVRWIDGGFWQEHRPGDPNFIPSFAASILQNVTNLDGNSPKTRGLGDVFLISLFRQLRSSDLPAATKTKLFEALEKKTEFFAPSYDETYLGSLGILKP